MSNRSRSVAWYTNVLGFRVEEQSDLADARLRIAMLERDGFELELVELGGSRSARELLPGNDNPAMIQGFGKLAFSIPDLDAWATRLRSHGVRFIHAPAEDAIHRTRWFIVQDVDGNWLQFFAPSPR